MDDTSKKLKEIKDKLPKGSIAQIAKELNLSEEEVKNYFNTDEQIGKKDTSINAPSTHTVGLQETIFQEAMKLLNEKEKKSTSLEEKFRSDYLKFQAAKLHGNDFTKEDDGRKGSLIIKSPGIGSVEEVINFLSKLETAYNRIYIYEHFVFNGALREITIKFDLDSLKEIKPSIDNKLLVSKVSFASAGLWELLGELNPLTQIRLFLGELHERKKDRKYRNKYEEQKLELEVEKVKLENNHENQRKGLENQLLECEVMKEKITILKEMGFSEEEVKTLSVGLFVDPIIELDKLLLQQKIESFEVIGKP